MAEFTGERVIPGQVDPDLLNEHLSRYAFAARLSRGKRVLDAGCGTGYGSAELAKAALSVLGVDRSDEALRFAREQYRLPNLCYAQGSVSALPLATACFDLVVSFEVIEHLPDWREFLLEVRRVLVPAGQFIVSTPNKLYYAESRRETGPNPYHEHEFEYADFRKELGEVFPDITVYLENHVEGVVFQPVEPAGAAVVRVDGADAVPVESHFFVAVCSHRPQVDNATFVYIPSTGNVLRERERHIQLLESELGTKDRWLDAARHELAKLNEEHERQALELEERNRWAADLDRELREAGGRLTQLQEELAAHQAHSQEVVARLDQEILEKTAWARETDRRFEQKLEELARCVEILHQTEKTLEDRTAWATGLQQEIDGLRAQLNLVRASRWMRFGKTVGLGPELAS